MGALVKKFSLSFLVILLILTGGYLTHWYYKASQASYDHIFKDMPALRIEKSGVNAYPVPAGMKIFAMKFDARINGEQLLAQRVAQALGSRVVNLAISKDRRALIIDHDLVWNDAEILVALSEAVDDPDIFGPEIPRSEGWRYYRHGWSDVFSGCDLDADYSAYHARKFLLEHERPFDDIALLVLDLVRTEPASTAAKQKKEDCSFG